MCSSFVESPESIRAQRLHQPDINVGVVITHELVAFELNKAGEPVQVFVEQLLTQLGRQVGLGIEQQRSDVVLQRALPSALVVHKIGIAVSQHDVARLEVSIQEKILRRAQNKIGQAIEVVFQRLFAERYRREAKKIIFEVVQVPGDGLPVKTRARVGRGIIQVLPRFHLKPRQDRYNAAI